jgi:hypothetical protein
MPSVAISGETTAAASKAKSLAGASGSWAAGPVTETPYPALKIDGKSVIHEAKCIFTFTNANTGATTLVEVKLSASATPLQHGLSGVLRHGDTITDENGNKLSVDTNRPATLTT